MKINITDGAEEIPVHIIKKTSVKEAVATLFTEMSEKDVKKAYKMTKRCWRAEKWQKWHEKRAKSCEEKTINLLKGENYGK